MCQVNKGETPRACPLYSLGQAGVIHCLFSSHPGPFFPTLFVHHSPVHGPHIQQPSQRTLWYSQAPAVEEKDIRPLIS